MDIMEVENVGFWIKTGKVWTHTPTGAQRHTPPSFEFHVVTRDEKTIKIRACEIEGVFILNSNEHIYSTLIGMSDGWPVTCILDDNVMGALRSWSLIDNSEEI